MTRTVGRAGGLVRRLRGDRGSEAIQAAIVTPLLVTFLCLAVAAGRIVMAAWED